jgi:hypothetical protein
VQNSKVTSSSSLEELGMTVDKLLASVSSVKETLRGQTRLTVGAGVQTTIESESVGAYAGRQVSEKGSPVTTGPYRSPDGQSLKDVINQAYKPREIIDLTLDDDEDDDDDDDDPVDAIPASVLHGARRLYALLAMESDAIQPERGQGEIPSSATLGFRADALSYNSMISSCLE